MAAQLRYDAHGRPYYSDRDWGEGFSLDTPAGQLVKPVPKPRQARSPVPRQRTPPAQPAAPVAPVLPQPMPSVFSWGGRNAPYRDMVPNTEPLPEQQLAMALGIPRDRLAEAAYAGRVRGINRVDAPPRQFPREFTPDSPATPEEIQRAFYGPSEPGSPPPEMSQAEYQRRKAMREGSAERLTPEEREAFFARAGVDPSALGAPIANPLQDRLRGDLTGLSPEEQAAGRLIQSTRNQNPLRDALRGPTPGPGEAGFGEGYYQGQSGVTVPGVGRRASNQVLGAGRVGTGYQSTGMNTGGAFGSSLMMGRAPELRVQERRAPAGGYLDFNEWLAAREAKPEDTGTAQPRSPYKPLGMFGTPMGGMVSASMIPSMAMGAAPALPHGLGVPAAYAGRGIPKPPVTPVAPVPGRQPVAPSAAGSWTDPVQPRFPPGRGGGPVYNPATATAGQAAAGTVAPAAAQAAAQAAGGPAPSPGFLRRAVPVGLGAGGGAVAVSMLAGGGQVQQVQMEDGTVVTIPVGETYEDKVARRRGLVAERGIQKGEARALRMGKAGPELLSRAYMAQSPEATAAIMAARERAMGEASANVPVAQAMMQQAQLQGLSAVLADPNATPEAKAQAQEQIANMPPIVAPYGGGIDPQQRYMGIPDYRGGAPIKPLAIPPAASAPGSRPVVGEIDPNAGDIRKQQEEILRQEKAQAEFDAQAARVQSGDAKGVIDNDPEIDSLVSSGVRPEYVVQRMIAKYPGMSRDAAMKEVQRRADKWSGYMDMVVPMY